jgi:general secretion pathway protein A
MNQKLLALYGLKWNPFTPEVPIEALHVPPKVENFCWRIEQAHLREGGFALIQGDPGTGKSVVMRLLAERLSRLADLSVGVIHHPQSNLSDFYRELGDIFSISIRVSNRWGGFKALRARWLDHLGSASRRPVVLIDEAQEMTPMVLSELRLLASARFDSQALLCVVLSGDGRLLDKLRRDELIPLGSRIRTRLTTGAATREELLTCLEHLLSTAGNAGLMTKELRHLLCDHAAGNYRILIGMAADLLMSAAQTETTVLDEKLYFQVFNLPASNAPRRARGGSLTCATSPIPSSSPSLPDEAAAALDQFLEDLYNSFQQRYGIQLYRYYRAIDERAARHRPMPTATSHRSGSTVLKTPEMTAAPTPRSRSVDGPSPIVKISPSN